MVYTVTFNPSLDYIVTVDDFKLGLTNRTTSELMLPGGKGINVSIVLSNLGIENTAIYFSAGFIGDEITRKVKECGIKSEEIKVSNGCSRVNLKLKSIDGTEINGAGPDISKEAIESFYHKLEMLQEGDTLVLAGSIPQTMPETIYSDIMARLSGKGIRIVVDATKDLLVNVLEYKPFLVKPNNHELGEIFGVELNTREEVVPYAKKMIEMGAENVIVSMAGQGAVFVSANGDAYLREAPEGKLVNGVGAGDSMVAGFIAGYLENKDLLHAFKMGLSAGSASAFSEYLATQEEVEAVYRTVK
ncbi:MAG: 1-phosphofructokinase [Lachnospiraceae bacterium]|nr:1-phosphofructokinase [Lachnospiraceae bacterium]